MAQNFLNKCHVTLLVSFGDTVPYPPPKSVRYYLNAPKTQTKHDIIMTNHDSKQQLYLDSKTLYFPFNKISDFKCLQETIVDKDSFEQIVVNALDDLNGRDSGVDNDDTRRHDEWMLPSKIFDAKCTLKKSEDSGIIMNRMLVTWITTNLLLLH